MAHYLNKKIIHSILWFSFFYQSCNFPIESEKKRPFVYDYSRSIAQCQPTYLKSNTLDSVLFALINDSQYINKKITNGYMIEISEEENYTKEVRFGDSIIKLPHTTLYLQEGFYKNKLKTGLWKKYYRFDMNCWILRENILYNDDKMILRKLVRSKENIYESELIGYPSCDSNFLRHREIEFKILYNNYSIKDSSRL